MTAPRPAGTPAEVLAKDARSAARRLFASCRPERVPFVTALLLGVVSVAFLVHGPQLLGRATDAIIQQSSGDRASSSSLRDALVLAASVFAAGAVTSWLQTHLLVSALQRTMSRLRTDVEEKVHRLPVSFLDRAPRGDVLSRMTNDIDNLAQSIQFSASQLLTALLTLVGVGLMMFRVSALLACLTLTIIPLATLIIRATNRVGRATFSEQWRQTGLLTAHVEEAFAGHAVVSAYGQHPHVEATLEGINQRVYQASFRAQAVTGALGPLTGLLSNLIYVVIAVVGIMRVSAGTLTVGDVQAALFYSRQFSLPLGQVAGMMNLIQSGLASAERVFELLDEPEESPDPAVPSTVGAVHGRVELAAVHFAYSPETPLIRELSLVAEAGETIAIVGPSGAGKTTLVNLLLRFYDLDAGSIRVDGVDISTLTRHALRAHIGLVLQDTWLFSGTIRDNIRYGRPDADDEEFLRASRSAYVDRFVQALPDGYDTHVDEECSNLSAGEKQLITIARAFLARPRILILDEATSSVDTRTELLVQHAMEVLRERRTSFVIAHRLSTIRDAHQILVMDKGRIVEQGTHDELLARHGAYTDLYESQLRSPATDLEKCPDKAVVTTLSAPLPRTIEETT